MPLNEQTVKLQSWWCVRHGKGLKPEAEKSLRAAAEKHHGPAWPEVERFYKVAHFKRGHKKASALISAYEHVVIYHG